MKINEINSDSLGVSFINMPLLSDTMESGKIVKWNKKVGDHVKSDDVIAEVETDKATMEVISYNEGYLLYVALKEGESIKVNGTMAIIGRSKDIDISSILNQIDSNSKTEIKNTQSEKSSVVENENDKNVSGNAELDIRIKASPLAKQLARSQNIDLKLVKGSGDNGRIIKRDLENLGEDGNVKKTTDVKYAETSGGFSEVEVTSMRRAIAKRLTESKCTAPHFYLTVKVLMDNVVKSRKKLNEIGETKISFNDIIVKFTALALKKHPYINSSWVGEKIRINHFFNIGIAVSIPEGLLVPVIKNADTKSLSEIATEIRALAKKAKEKILQPKEWEGSTFTISNLGMFGIDNFTSIINSPNSCILAVSAIKEEPVVKDNQIAVGHTMNLTLSCDHRIVDGSVGAAFMQTLKNYLEDPIMIMA